MTLAKLSIYLINKFWLHKDRHNSTSLITKQLL